MFFSSYPRAERFVRRFRGSSQAIEVEADDGYTYAVKLCNNPNGPRALVSEFFAGRLYRHLDVPTSPVRVIELSPDFVARNPGIAIKTLNGPFSPPPGPHLGTLSRRSTNATSSIKLFDWLPREFVRRPEIDACYWSAMVLDLWLGKDDARQALFWSSSNDRTGNVQVLMIDHRRSLAGASWNLDPGPTPCLSWSHPYSEPFEMSRVLGMLGRIEALSRSSLLEIIADVPPVWIGRDGEELAALVESLMLRKRALPLFVESVLRDMRCRRDHKPCKSRYAHSDADDHGFRGEGDRPQNVATEAFSVSAP